MRRGGLASPCRIPVLCERASSPIPKPKRNHQIQRDDSLMASARSSRKSHKYSSSNNDSGSYRRNSSNYANIHETYIPPAQQQPAKSSYFNHPNMSRCKQGKQCDNTPTFEKDFGPFGGVVMQQQQDKKQGDDIHAMFRRPDYDPAPCSEHIRGPPRPTLADGGWSRGVGNRPVTPIGGGQYNSRNRLDVQYDYPAPQHAPWDAEGMSVIEEGPEPPMLGGNLPPMSEPIVTSTGSRSAALSGSRRNFKGEDLDRILAKYGKTSRSNVSNEYAEKDPDFSSMARSDTFRMTAEKFCDPVINNGAQGFWSHRKNDDLSKLSGGQRSTRRVSERENENLVQQKQGGGGNTNDGGGGGGHSQRRNNSLIHPETLADQNEKDNIHVDKMDRKMSTGQSSELKRSTHAFPFKETPTGHLVIEPNQIAFESRKISVLVADPNNNSAVLEFSTAGSNNSFPYTSRNERILHEVKRAMSISEHSGLTNSSGSKLPLQHQPWEINQKKYTDAKESSEDFQRSVLQRITSARNADTHILIGDKIYPCHSLALESFSGFFDRLTRPQEYVQRIQLPESEVSPTAFQILMDWILQSKEGRRGLITKENLVQVYAAAKHLGMRELEFQCVSFLEKKVDPTDPELMQLWDEVKKRPSSCADLVRIIASKMSANYHDIYASRRFLPMEVDELHMLLSSDDISIESEMDVYDSAVSWLLHDWKNRKPHTSKIMSTVRFGLLSPLQLTQINLCPEINKVKSEKDYNQILAYGTVKSMIDDGLSYSILDESYKTQPDELKKWVGKTGVKAPTPRTSLVNKRLGKPLIMEKVALLEGASNTKLDIKYSKIPDKSSSFTILGSDHQPRPGTPFIDTLPPQPPSNSSHGKPPSQNYNYSSERGFGTERSKSRIPTMHANSNGTQSQNHVASPSTSANKTPFSPAEKGNNARPGQGQQVEQVVVHEISKPKLLTNSSNMLTKAGSSEEISGESRGRDFEGKDGIIRSASPPPSAGSKNKR